MSLVQALVLNQDIGLWSGNRRRMEIAECRESLSPTLVLSMDLISVHRFEHSCCHDQRKREISAL